MVADACIVTMTAIINVNVNGIFILEETVDKKIDIINGINIIASNIAENGSGLKSKYCPFENGNVNIRIISVETMRETPLEIRKTILAMRGTGFVLMFLYIPIIAPNDTNSIPMARTE
jgi:hypothetical protein